MSLKNRTFVRTVEVIFGLMLIFFGLNGFFQFMPAPEFSGAAGEFLGALFATGYIFPILSIINIVAGLLFITNRCAALGAILVFPFTVNIMLFHLFLDLTGISFALVITVLNLYTIWVHWNAYTPMCK